MEEYARLTSDQKASLDHSFESVQHEIERQSLIAVIRDTARRFEESDYRRLLTNITDWTRPEPPDDGLVIHEPRVIYVPHNRLHIPFARPYLANEADVDEYLDRVREVLLAEIQDGKRIQL